MNPAGCFRFAAVLAAAVLGTGCRGPRMTLTATPQEVAPGEVVRISSPLDRLSSKNPDLRFDFLTDGDNFSTGVAESSPLRFWTAPSAPGVHRVTVVAYDKQVEITRKTVTVTVRPPSGRTLDVQFAAPPAVTQGGTIQDNKVALDEQWKENTHSGRSCSRIVCQAGNESCRVTWSAPPGNFGQERGLDLSWAKTLSFWARGHRGGEHIRVWTGAEREFQYPSTLAPLLAKDPVSGRESLDLTTDWRQFTIPLKGDLSNLPVLFDVLALPAGGAPVILYLDDIFYAQ